jgi:hypothetical protein
MLILASFDMDRVMAAAEAIRRERESATPDETLIEALETAVVVCYWRPFSKSNTAGCLEDSDALDPILHAELKTLRDEAHAHIDSASGRTAGITPVGTLTGVTGFAYTESWWSSVEERLVRIVDVAQRQRDSFRAAAHAIP